MRIKFFATAGLMLCVALAGCSKTRSSLAGLSSGAGEDKSPVIVEINDRPEHQAAFERFVKARLSDFADQSTQTQAEKDKQLSGLFDEFIRRQLIVQEAMRKNIEPTDDEIRRALEEQHKQTSTQHADQNLPTLEGSERRVEIYHDLLKLKYESEALKDVLSGVKVSPQEIEDYYKKNEERYQNKNSFLIREIRVFEEARAQQIYKQALAKPDDFGVLAKQNSEAPTAANGGLINYEAQQLPKVLEQAITPLKVGSISKVVRSSYGFHIFKLERRGEPMPLEQVKKEIEDKLVSEKNQLLIDQFNQRLLGSARINIYRDKLGFNYLGNYRSGS
ncbi:MAG: peptidyl-prolyl cis-trans isomerase [Blastocatellia bacterium]|nr:peptidyl-prolyl cis-trans isomerase [Blastocatellia bacterium]